MKRWILILLAMAALSPAVQAAQTTMMARSQMPFEPALEKVQEVLAEHGYTVAHIQKCDGGMAQFGYHSDKYQLVFFGKLEEVRRVSHNHPEMIPFLPLKLAVFAENQETLVVALDPLELGRYINDPHLQIQLARWHSDLRSILQEMRDAR